MGKRQHESISIHFPPYRTNYLKRFLDLIVTLPITFERAVRDDVNMSSADYVITRVGLLVSLSHGASNELRSKDL